MNKKLRLCLPVIVLSILLLISSFLSIFVVYAGNGFMDNNWDWKGYKNRIYATDTSTYPFDVLADDSETKKPVVNSIGLDIIYGKTRPIIFYNGGLPEENVTNDDGDLIDNYDSYAIPDTTLDCGGEHGAGGLTNPGNVTAYDYWGFDDCGNCVAMDSEGKITLNDMQNVNKDKVVSLRLYALSNCNYGVMAVLANVLYFLVQGLASIANFIVDTIIKAKNIDMNSILEILQLDKLAKTFSGTFIADSEKGTLSPFMAFAIIMFIFAIVMYVIRYVKGGNKTESLSNIIITTLCGILVIGMCLTGKIHTLGSSLSTMSERLMYSVAGSMSEVESSGTSLFVTDIIDEERQNQVTQMQEISLINKTFIDLQICTQFGVKDIDDLLVDNLGDANGGIAKETLAYANDVDFESNFGNNLGYYYWFAHSSAKEKTDKNKTIPETNTSAIDKKLDSMMTYLQKCYNNGNSSTQTKIQNIVLGFATPHTIVGSATMLLFAVILVLLALCTLKYALNVMFAKLGMFFALVGMTLAGPFLVTNNKKLVSIGKSILGLLVVSLLHITVYSIFFDLIIFIISSIISPKFSDLLIAAFLTGLLFYFNPIIQQTLKKMLEKTSNTVCKEYSQSARMAKQWARQKATNLKNNYDSSEKIVGYDENNNPIKQTRKGDRLSKLMNQGFNNVFNEGQSREGIFKINSDMNTERRNKEASSRGQLRKVAESKVRDVQEKINKDKEAYEKQFEFESNQRKRDTYIENKQGTTFNESLLTNDELLDKQELDNLIKSKESMIFTGDREEKDLLDEADKLKQNISNCQANVDNLSKNGASEQSINAQKQALARAQMKYASNQQKLSKIQADKQQFEREKREKEEEIHKKTSNLQEKIDSRIKQDILTENGYSESKSFEEAASRQAQADNKEELSEALKSNIETAKADADEKLVSQGKIGSMKTVNKDALQSLASAEYQLRQLDQDKLVSDKSEADAITKNVVDSIARSKEFSHDVTSTKHAATAYMEHDAASNKRTRGERKLAHQKARRDVNEAVSKDRELIKEGTKIELQARKDTNSLFSTRVSEDITAAFKNLEIQERQIHKAQTDLDTSRKSFQQTTTTTNTTRRTNL